jgi:hypothetical protein
MFTNSFISRATSFPVQSVGNQEDKDDLWSLAFKIWNSKDNSGGQPITVNSLADFMYSTVVDSINFTRAYGKNKKAAVDDAKKAAKKYLGKN